MPLVLVGRNADLAWGLTYSYIDDADLFIERLDPDDPGRYRTPDGWAELDLRTERIAVAGREAETVTLARTRHGPVVPPDQLGVGEVTPEGHVAALAWTALSEPDTSLSAGFALMTARTLEEGAEAMEALVAPAMNVTLADRSGVGMVVAGAAPLRNPESPSRGRLPAPGWRAENDWLGLIPPGDLPRVLRPASGAVANANNRTAGAPYPRHLSHHWGDPYRIRRIEKELTAREFHTRDSAAALQNDAVSEMARAVLPLIARDLWWTGPAAPADPVAARRAEALEMLGDWNGEMSAHAPEPLIFAEWMRRLTDRLAGDELGPAVAEIAGPRPVFVERVFRDVDGAGIWCDIDKTARTETCAEIAALALDDALAGLAERYGASPRGWRWGEAHEARHDHEVLGRLGPLAPLVNIRHEASGGDYTVLRAQSRGRGADPHAAVNAAGLRMVVDFADPDASSIVIATGQSGHRLSRHYDDFSQLWRRGDSVRLSLDFADAEAGALGVVALVPAQNP
jgi:penicillin amidase